MGQTMKVQRQEIERHIKRKASVPIWLCYKLHDGDVELKPGNYVGIRLSESLNFMLMRFAFLLQESESHRRFVITQ